MIFIEKYGLTFKKDETGYFIPDKYDVKLSNDMKGKGKKIAYDSEENLGRCLFSFILFAKSSGVETDVDTGKEEEGYLDIYQYIIAYIVIKHLLLLDSSDIITAIARQSGKSHISRMLIAFSVTFIPLYIKVKQMRWYSTLCSFKNDTAEDQLGKTHPHILDALNLFNKIYPNKPLQYDCNIEEKGRNRKLKWNSNLIEINRSVKGKSIPYSAIDILGLDKNTKTPGYTSHFLFVDESQDINADAFNTNAKLFSQRTGGICFSIGTANNEPESLLRDMYNDKAIDETCRVLIDVEEVIKYQLKVSETHVKEYSQRFNKEIKKYGKHSDYIQTQYYINFNIVGDNFTSLERLRSNNLFLGDIEMNFICDNHEYKIGAVDPALGKDMAGMMAGSGRFGESSVISELKNVIVLHDKNTAKKSPDELVNLITNHCIAQQLDYLILDTTGNQKDRAFYLYKNFRKYGCNTMIVPYDYSGQNKKTMMGYLEDSIYNQSLILPKESYRESDCAYDEAIKQLLYLKKKRSKTNGNLEYKAPEGKDFYDDLPMTLAQFNYALEYIRRSIAKKLLIDLGEGVKYYITYNKYKKKEETPYIFPRTYMTVL
jgi:hypothetical protein